MVKEADLDCHLGRWLPGQEKAPGPINPPADHIRVRRDGKGRREISRQMADGTLKLLAGLGQGDRAVEVGGEEVSELMGHPGVERRCVRPVAEVGAEPGHDWCNPGLGGAGNRVVRRLRAAVSGR